MMDDDIGLPADVDISEAPFLTADTPHKRIRTKFQAFVPESLPKTPLRTHLKMISPSPHKNLTPSLEPRNDGSPPGRRVRHRVKDVPTAVEESPKTHKPTGGKKIHTPVKSEGDGRTPWIPSTLDRQKEISVKVATVLVQSKPLEEKKPAEVSKMRFQKRNCSSFSFG
jgi:hypothetical protein